ncbi:MAG: V-type ATP synthase subunit E [bacterium]|jgi:V/A-type H+-transporting ATPase subunit E
MGKAEKLKQKILSDAEAEARKILEEGEAEAGAIRAEAQAEADKATSQYQARAEADAAEHIRRQTSLRELEARKAVLAEKGRLIEEVFDKVLENLREKDRAGGYGLTRELLLKAIETGTEEIIVAPDDRKAIDKAFIDSLNAEISKTGKKGEITLSEETRDMRGGFILRRGRTESNSSFDTLLTMLRDDVESRVAGILFGETESGEAGARQ